MKKIIVTIVGRFLGILGFVATYFPLVASWVGFNMWGLPWHLWAMIGFTIFWITMVVEIWRLNSKIKQLEGHDATLVREERKLNIKNGLLNFWERTVETPLPIDLKNKFDEIDKL